MAIIQMTMFSKCLLRTVPVTCIVPFDNVRFEGDPMRPEGKPYKTLYLLNGGFGGHMDWLAASDIMGEAQRRSLVVVMPAGENHHYVDNEESGLAFGRFIGEELVDLTRRAFHLSHDREDTYIAGLSMGGYGAIHNGLKYGDTFGYAAGLSSALNVERRAQAPEKHPVFIQSRGYLTSVFGNLDKLVGSDKDPKALYLRKKEENALIPKLYLACGTEDHLYGDTQEYRDFLIQNGADLTYEEGPGGHDYVFWNQYIKHVLDWLPLEQVVDPMSSGNVRKK